MKFKFLKGCIGTILSFSIIAAWSITAFAEDNSVSKTQDNITISKTAQWTTYEGNSVDAKGNPYIDITFKIDTSNATTEIINTVSKGGDVDVALVIDNTASYEAKFPKAREAAAEFVENVMSLTTHKVRVGVVEFGNQSYIKSELSSNKAEVKKIVEDLKIDPVRNGTNMHYGVYNGTKLLEGSNAKTKLMIILSDGEPNRVMGVDRHDTAGGLSYTQSQLETAKSTISNLKIVTIGYCSNNTASNLLKGLASEDVSGNKMYYTSNDTVSDITRTISGVFEQITETVTTYVTGNSLVDLIPEECDIVADSIKISDSKLISNLANQNKTIMFSWGNNKLEKKIYEVSFVVSLDKNKLTDKQLKGEENFNTNGNTIDVSVDSLGSSYFSYGEQGIIKLESPKLNYAEKTNVKEEAKQEGLKDDEIVENDGSDVTPATGDSFNYIVLVGIVISIIMLVVVRVKVRKKYQ